MSNSNIEVLTWKEAREGVQSVNSGLAAILDDINPGSKYKLYGVKYPYGEMVFKEAELNIPNSASTKIKEDLNYRTIPLGIVLKNSLEVHTEEEQRTIPLTVLTEGTLFGIWEMFDPLISYFVKPAWNVSSGSRSLFLLPPISNRTSFLRLKKEFNLSNPPNKIKDHWKIFKQIAQSSFDHPSWHSKVLFFSKEWSKKLDEKNSWKELKLYLYQQAWKQTMFWRFSSTMNLVWQSFAQHMSDKNVKFCPYSLETLKHAITIGVGALPSFSAHSDKHLCAPISLLQKAFLDIYKIEYIPTIMAASHLSEQKEKSFNYYSCSLPTFIESYTVSKSIRNVLTNIKEIQHLFMEFKEEVLKDKIKVRNTPIYDLMSHCEFKFIHTHYDGSLTLSTKLQDDDKSLLSMPAGYANKEFCSGSPFFKGCIRIRRGVAF